MSDLFHEPGDNTNRNFKGQMKTEEVLCFCRKHWIVIFPHIVGFFLGVGVVLFHYFGVDKAFLRETLGVNIYQIGTFISVLMATILLHGFFVRIFNYYLQILIVTNYRIIDLDKTLFFRDNRNTIDISEIQDMTMQQSGILQTVLDYGEVTIILSSASQPRTMRFMPNPEYHFRKINKTKREYIMRRQFDKGVAINRDHVDLKKQIDGTSTAEAFEEENVSNHHTIS